MWPAFGEFGFEYFLELHESEPDPDSNQEESKNT